jgi:AbiV family abortive infection protein
MMPSPEITVKNRKWSDLTFKEFEGIYPTIELNAKRHFRCAEVLVKAGEHQNAIAHLILGTEELIKAFGGLLTAKRMGIKQQPWFGRLFYHHKTRHELIKDFFSIYLLINFSADRFKNRKGFWATVGKVIGNTVIAAGNYKWWNKADDLKQRAFYVDFVNVIIDPADITIDDYEIADRYVKIFREDITKLMREIETASPTRLKNMERDFDLNKIGELREQAYQLSKIKKA